MRLWRRSNASQLQLGCSSLLDDVRAGVLVYLRDVRSSLSWACSQLDRVAAIPGKFARVGSTCSAMSFVENAAGRSPGILVHPRPHPTCVVLQRPMWRCLSDRRRRTRCDPLARGRGGGVADGALSNGGPGRSQRRVQRTSEPQPRPACGWPAPAPARELAAAPMAPGAFW